MKIFSHYLVFLPYEYVQVLNMSQRQDGFSPVLTYISCLPNVVFRVFHITRSTRGFSTLFTLLWFLFPLVYLTRTVTPKGHYCLLSQAVYSENHVMHLKLTKRPGGLPTFLMFIQVFCIFWTFISFVYYKSSLRDSHLWVYRLLLGQITLTALPNPGFLPLRESGPSLGIIACS